MVALADVQGPGTEYLRELSTLATGDVSYGKKAELLDVQHQEVTKQAGVLTKAIIAIATQGAGVWTTFAANAAVDGVIAGEVNLDNLVKDAAFTFATAGFDTLNPKGFQGVSGEIKNIAGISPAVDGSYFNSDWALNTAVDSTTSGLIQTGIYGGNLGDNIGDSLKGSVVNEGTALGFNHAGTGKLLGELADGSPGAVGLHALIGCASYAAQGADCAAGAVQAGGVEFYAGTLPHGLSKDEYMQQTHDAAALAGVLTSKGDPGNIGRATGMAASAGENNFWGLPSPWLPVIWGADRQAKRICAAQGLSESACKQLRADMQKDVIDMSVETGQVTLEIPVTGTAIDTVNCVQASHGAKTCTLQTARGLAIDVVITATGGVALKMGGKAISYVVKTMPDGSRKLVNPETGGELADEIENFGPAGADIPTIGGRKPINFQWAGKTHPSGIEFDNQGFPRFEPHAQASFQADNLTGNYRIDDRMANQTVGFDDTPAGFTWHHHQDGRTMLLVPKELHQACRHTGGCAVIRNGGSFD